MTSRTPVTILLALTTVWGALTGLVPAGIAHAATPIVLDGWFSDWAGQPNLGDPPDDIPQINFREDIESFHWATNPGQSALYFMAKRYAKKERGNKTGISQPIYFIVYLSLDDDDDFSEEWDRAVRCYYDPTSASGSNAWVEVDAGNNLGDPIGDPPYVYEGRWGQPYVDGEGGLMVEWYVPFEYLGLSAGQPIRMYLASTHNYPAVPHVDVCPDDTTIGWAPVPTLGVVGTVLLLLAGLTIAYAAFRRSRARKAVPQA